MSDALSIKKSILAKRKSINGIALTLCMLAMIIGMFLPERLSTTALVNMRAIWIGPVAPLVAIHRA